MSIRLNKALGKRGAEAKASLNRARVRCYRPETKRSIHEQVEVRVKPYGGPNQLLMQ